MILLDQEKHNKIDKYLSKFEIIVTSGLGLFTFLVTYVFLFLFAEKISSIPLAETKERLAKKKVGCMEEWTEIPRVTKADLLRKEEKLMLKMMPSMSLVLLRP